MKNGKKGVLSVIRLGSGIIITFLCIMILKMHVSASETETFSLEMDVEQSSTRDMLVMINDFRTGDDAWQYNYSGEKEYITAEGLTYDYDLEQVAIQRAYEIAICFSHTRPNGEDCFTCTYHGTESYGENIAVGQESAEEVFVAWREDDYDYDGQGHRRNMLDPDFSAIGIGHVRYQGYDYWVQEFGCRNSKAPYTEPENGTVTATVDVKKDWLFLSLKPTSYYFNDTYGNTGDLPGIKGYLCMKGTWSYGIPIPDSDLSSVQWASEDTSIVTVSGDKYTVVGTGGRINLIAGASYGELSATCKVEFFGFQRLITDKAVSVSVPNADFLPDGAEPKPVVTMNGVTLKENVDYTLSYFDNDKAVNYARVQISGIGNFYNNRIEYFEIYAVDINKCNIDTIADVTYTGNAFSPSVSGTLSGQNITSKHYTISSIKNNTNAGTATVVLQGRNGLTGTKEMNFKILPRPLSDCTLSPISSKPYTGSEITPDVSIKYNGKELNSSDFKLSCKNNVNIGTAKVTVTGKGNYTGSIQSTFEITKVPMSNISCSGKTSVQYTGEPVKPTLAFTYGSFVLEEGKDFTINYSDNVNVGKATATLTGKGIYEGTKTIQFSVYSVAINDCDITTDSLVQYYTGSAICPAVTIMHGTKKLVQDRDYTVSYGNNINATYGGATILLQGTGNYSGTLTYRFDILRVSVENLAVESVSDQTYSGSELQPSVVLKSSSKVLTAGTDYTISYRNNINAGTATITLTGKGNYYGTKKQTFTILPKSISKFSVGSIPAQTYTGLAISPEVTVKDGNKVLTKGADYTVSGSSNVSASKDKAMVTITGKGNYTGSKSVKFVINPANLADLTISDIPAQIYTGKAITPDPVIYFNGRKLTADVDFTVDYKDNIKLGTAKVELTGIGNFTGKNQTEFIIQKERVYNVFSDVKKGQWYVSAIQYVYDYDIMAGKSATEFGTSQPLKREQFVQVLYNHMGKPEVTSANSFEDVKKGAYYYDAVLWAKENKIADGKIKNGKSIFGVGQNISREELALMLYRYAKLRGYNVAREAGATEGYADSNKVSLWAKEAMEWAVTRGIMSGKGGDDVPKSEIRLDPAGNATRAECASMMKKLLEMNQ